MGSFINDFYSGKSAGGIGKLTPYGAIFGGKEGIEPRPDYPYMSAEQLYGWANDYQKKYPYDPAKPYSGQLSAPMNQTEWASQDLLSKYINQGTASSLNAANTYNTDVLQGKYDPRTSPYYAQYKNQLLKDAEEAGAAIRHTAATKGLLHSDPRHIQERKYSENVADQLATVLASLYESERGRMTTAASQAPQIAQSLSSIPLQKITAGSSIGAIPRQTQQTDLDRQYQEYARQVAGAREPLNVFQALSGQNYSAYPAQTYSTGQDTAGQLTSTLTSLLPYIMMLV